MRVTNRMMSQNVVNNIQTNMSKLDKTNDKLSKGTKISMPGDDPTGAVKTMAYKTTLNEIEKFTANTQNAKNFLSYTDVALGQVGDVIQRIRELTVQATTETYEQTARDSIAAEINELLGQIVSVANSKIGDKFIFAGFNTLEKPFETKTGNELKKEASIDPSLTDVNGNKREGINAENIVKVEYTGDDGKLLAEIDKGIVVEYNVPGARVFTNNEHNLVDSIIKLRDEILKGNTVEDRINSGTTVNNELGNLDKNLDILMRYRAEVGAKMNRMEAMEQRQRDNKVSMTDLLSKTQDTDITETINDLKVQESVQRMSLSVGAKVIQPTLVDFLK
ncbi:MAG: flagellar hook-associated protein FlgL [Fusobacteriaceae bacterium]|nr:flagellar hook-associated protein FlgL [Fusobacteriaceae bacterium]MBN2837388.1 flagellar hook-associated protein FlgL [Fusobacteriaceae bacterium]